MPNPGGRLFAPARFAAQPAAKERVAAKWEKKPCTSGFQGLRIRMQGFRVEMVGIQDKRFMQGRFSVLGPQGHEMMQRIYQWMSSAQAIDYT